MLTVAYLANLLPSPVEPYVAEEIEELRSRGVHVIAGSVRKPVATPSLANAPEIILQSISPIVLARAVLLCLRRWPRISDLIWHVVCHGREGPVRRMKALLHTWLGACYAVMLEEQEVDHIHVHHGYFGSWIAMVAARLQHFGFSLTLHGSDLLTHGAYLDLKLKDCSFCRRRLAEKGHQVTIYCRNYFTPPQREPYHGMRLVRLSTIRSKHLETVVHTLLSTAHALSQRYDIVHYHALGPALFSCVPRILGAKTVVTVQGLDWQRKKWGRLAAAVLRLGERASVNLPNATMVVSQALRERYLEMHGRKAFYVPNGGLLRERREPRAILEWGLVPGDYILFLGRFSPEKGCHLLVDAFERLHTDVQLVMAGASSYCDDYSQELRRHAGERVRMLDWVSGETLDELLANAMIFVLPSDLEGLSLALLDAMGAGLCVLTSDVPENREVVDGAGFTFKRGDAADLTDRLRFLIANPAVREAAGKAAMKRIREQYLWDKIAADIEAVYFDVLGWKQAEIGARKPNVRFSADRDAAASERRAG